MNKNNKKFPLKQRVISQLDKETIAYTSSGHSRCEFFSTGDKVQSQ